MRTPDQPPRYEPVLTELSIGLVGPGTDCVLSLGSEEWPGGGAVGPALELSRRKERSS